MTITERLRGPRPLRRGLLLLAVEPVLAGVWVWGQRSFFDHAVIEQLVGQSTVLGLVAATVLAWALLCLPVDSPRLGQELAVGALAVGVALAGTAQVVGLGYAESTSPNGRYRAITDQGPTLVEEAWAITIRQNRGFRSRQWRVGCGEVSAVWWDGPDTLVLGTRDSHHEIARQQVDPRSGRPIGRPEVDEVTGPMFWSC